MNESEFQKLREASWRRPLSRDEEARLQAWLANRPDACADWEEDAALGGLLAELPNVPVASNFTNRVLHRLDRQAADGARQTRATRFTWRHVLRWLPQAATTVLIAAVAITGYSVFQQNQERKQMAPGVELAQTMATLPAPDSLRDFNAILELSAVARPVDFELLEALE